ncbi:MAG: DUF2793 domain-containing protein [Parvularculaceae bacterium]
MDLSPRLSLSYVLPQQAQKHVTVNETFRRLDALVQLSVLSRTAPDEPATPAEGDAYLLPVGKSGGAWSAFADHSIASFRDGAWSEIAPSTGFVAYVADEDAFYRFASGLWGALSMGGATNSTMLGVNTNPDATNRLAVKSDASLFNHDDVTPGSGDHRLTINKSAADKTASAVFQSNASGRAEFGLTGDENFHVKVSSDGAAWTEAVVIDAASGYAGFGAAAPQSALHVKQPSDARLTIDTATPSQGGGFDIVNSGDGANWRVTGQASLFKIRDHAVSLDKLIIEAGAGGNACFDNFANLGVGVPNPQVKLEVDGPVRVKSYGKGALPSANPAGQIVYVTNEAGGATIAFSDGSNWRRVADRAVVS